MVPVWAICPAVCLMRVSCRVRCRYHVFSLASAIEIIEEMGFSADYFVSPNWSCTSSADWNRELCFRLGLMLEHVRPEVIVFDGTWPYPGVMGACRAYGKAVVD